MVVIGDIHGCLKSLKKLLSILPKDAELYSVGDLIDRGADSKGVVSLCIDRGIKPVMGNHEHLFIDYLEKTGIYGRGIFFVNGGNATLKSYGMSVPSEHLDFLTSLPLCIETEHFILSHAGLHPTKTMKEACNINEEIRMNILWNRGTLADLHKLQIIGHTPQKKPMEILNKGKVVGLSIDTGCVYPSLGKLTAISFPKREIFQVDCED